MTNDTKITKSLLPCCVVFFHSESFSQIGGINPFVPLGYNWLLTEGSERANWGLSFVNSWVTQLTKRGDGNFVIIDLGCKKEINGYYIRNFHRGHNFYGGCKVR